MSIPPPGDQPLPNFKLRPLSPLEAVDMYRHHVRQYNELVAVINNTHPLSLQADILLDQCPFRPELLVNYPLPITTCPLCEAPITLGSPHPRSESTDVR